MKKIWNKGIAILLTCALTASICVPLNVYGGNLPTEEEMLIEEVEISDFSEEEEESNPQVQAAENQEQQTNAENEEQENTIEATGIKATGYVPIEEESELYDVDPSEMIMPYALAASYDPRTDGGIVTPVMNQGYLGVCWAISAMSAGEISLMQKGIMGTGDQFSKLHLAYSAFHGADGAAQDPTSQETFMSSDWMRNGGNRRVSCATLGRWYGAEEEAVVPYSLAFLENAEQKIQEAVNLRSSVSHLRSSYWYPEIVLNGQTRENNLVWIKNGINQYGAVEISFNSDDTYYDKATNSYYNSAPAIQDHAVIIVGWDDNKITKAGTPGAFLCKNSWGTSWGDNGYFWISYYDKSMASPSSYEFEATASGSHEYTINNQYDGIGYGGYLRGTYRKDTGYQDVRSAANVFTAKQAQDIGAVSFYVPASATNYSVKIYTDVEDTPSSGELIQTIKGESIFAGFYTVDFEPVYVKAGEKFAVELMIASKNYTSGTKSIYLPIEMGYEGEVSAYAAPIKAGQTYIRTVYGWQDAKTISNAPYNLCIKALSNPARDSYTVSFKSMGKTYKTVEVWEGDTVAPVKPKAVKNHVFYGWYKDSACTNEFSFDKRIRKNTNIYTRWGKWQSVSKSGKTYWKYYPNIKENKYVKSQWMEIAGKLYRFNSYGYMNTGWYRTSKGNYYYLGSDGAVCYGWKYVGGKYYYLKKSSGKMLTGWQTIGGKTYYLGSDGARRTGRQKISGKWYTFDKNGVLK